MTASKRCTKCGEAKPLADFHKQKLGRYGVASTSKSCVRSRSKQYYEQNTKAISDRRKKWRQDNKDAFLTRQRKYYAANRDKCLAYHNKHASLNYQKVRETSRLAQARAVNNLSDGYVKQLLERARVADVPPEILALKREQVRLRRIANKLKRAVTPPKDKQ